MSEVIKNKLFLGSVDNALDKNWLNHKKIQTIVSVMSTPSPHIDEIAKHATANNITHHIFNIDDITNANISDIFQTVYDIIEHSDIVLIHCFMGISRSATLVLAYLMMKQRIYLDKATELVLDVREYIFPNDGFILQLFQLEKQIMGQMTYLPDKYGIMRYKNLLHGIK